MVANPNYDNRMTAEEYLAFDRNSEFKHEFANGEILAMTGASLHHTLICANFMGVLRADLRKLGCRAVQSDLRVQVKRENAYRYPDVTVYCGDPDLSDEENQDTLLNPLILAEVLSPTSEKRDRGQKFHEYRQIESLQEYLIISQDVMRVEQYTRQTNNKWILTICDGAEAILQMSSIDCEITLADLYEDVTFEQASDETETD